MAARGSRVRHLEHLTLTTGTPQMARKKPTYTKPEILAVLGECDEAQAIDRLRAVVTHLEAGWDLAHAFELIIQDEELEDGD